MAKKVVRHRSVEKSHRFNEGGERKRALNVKTNMAKEQFFSAGGNSERRSQVSFNKYPAKAEGYFADLPSVRDSQATTNSRMREYRQKHVHSQKSTRENNLRLKPSRTQLLEEQRRSVEGKSY